MARPIPPDADAMRTLLTRMKSQLEQLANRAQVTVGRRWQVREDPKTGDLVASIPSSGRKVVLATPDGTCGLVADCVADALDPTLQFSGEKAPRLGARISGQAGNTLTRGDDGGLYAGGGGGWAEFSGPHLVEGGTPTTDIRTVWPAEGVDINTFDASDFPGVWSFPDGPYGVPFIPGDDPLGNWNPGAWQPTPDTMKCRYSTTHAPPGEMSLHFPGGIATASGAAGFDWNLVPWDEWYVPYGVNARWVGAGVDADFTCVFTGEWPAIAPGPLPPDRFMDSMPVTYCLLNFWPGFSLYVEDGYLWAKTAPVGATLTRNTTLGVDANRRWAETYFARWQPGAGTYTTRQGTRVPLDVPVRFRVQLRRAGQNVVWVYIGDDVATRPVEQFDTYLSLGPAGINFDYCLGSPPFFTFGPQVGWNEFLYPYDPVTDTPAVTVPEMWMTDVKLRIGLPDPVWWPPPPTNPT
jgi:hypothetical protein